MPFFIAIAIRQDFNTGNSFAVHVSAIDDYIDDAAVDLNVQALHTIVFIRHKLDRSHVHLNIPLLV